MVGKLPVTHHGDLPTGETTVVDVLGEVIVDPSQSVGVESECCRVGCAVECAHHRSDWQIAAR